VPVEKIVQLGSALCHDDGLIVGTAPIMTALSCADSLSTAPS